MRIIVTLVAAGGVLAPVLGAQDPAPIRYVVRPVARDSLVELAITLRVSGDPSGRTRVRLPADRFGVRDMHRFVRGVEVGGGTASWAPGDSLVLIDHRSGADLSVRYRVRFDSATAGFVAYGPSVGPKHFHFLGSQWMARVGASDAIRSFEIRVERGALPGPLAGSFGLEPGTHQISASQDELDWSVIAGGAYREHRFACRGRPLAVLVRGAFAVTDDSLVAAARRIACEQRDMFADHTQPFYAIVLTARNRLRAGASFLNAFACFARPDSDVRQLAALLAHEMTHAWIPRKLRVVPDADDPVPPVEFSWFHDIRYDWFHEGFTEYLSRVLLVRAGLAGADWFAERLNDDIARLAIHPYRASTAYELEDAARAGRFTNFHQRISYLRGSLLAFRWDAMLRRNATDSLDLVHAVRRLLAAAQSSGGRLPRSEFERVLTRMGVPAAHDVARLALGGGHIPVDSLGLGPEWQLEVRTVPAFAPGFDVVASTSADTVLGVRPDGAAYAAGLRDGMAIVRHRNAWRWNDEWRPDEPLEIVVREDGRERTIAFNPVHGNTPVPYFVRRADGSSGAR
ncbi:MAG: hypothetical protein ACREMN_13825 [Gemmatimonadales bacterium]